MTIGVAGNRVAFNCDSVTKIFPVPLQAYLPGDFVVELTAPTGGSVVLVLNSDYSMATSSTDAPPKWTLTTLAATAFLTGYSLQVFVSPAQVQQTQYVQGQQFPSLAVQTNMDRLTQMVQRLQDQLSRAVLAPDGDVSPLLGLANAKARASTLLGFDVNGNATIAPSLATVLTQAAWDIFLTASAVFPTTLQSDLNLARTASEIAKGITPSNLFFPPGSLYRYGAKGGAARIADGVLASSSVITSASGGFAGAIAGMVCVVVDGGASRVGGRPAPFITTILSVQSANQITLNGTVTQPGTVTMNGTLNATVNVTSTSVNPITAGVGLTRIWAVSGTNIPANTTVSSTSASTLVLNQAASGSGVSALTLTAPLYEVCFGFDDSVAIQNALNLPYPITDVKDNFLTTQPLTVATTGGIAGCQNISLPSALIIFAIANNTPHCLTAKGLDRTNNVRYFNGIRYLPFKAEFGEVDCCNTGLAGVSFGPAYNSILRILRLTNTFRSALEEFFLTDNSWQEGNYVDINCGLVGHHFHHKVTKSNGSYQTLGAYKILGRSPGLNSVFLGINAGTQPDQLGGAIRLYTAGGSSAGDGGMAQNTWGGQSFCEMDGQRSTALSFGSDICNSAVTFVDASANYVIEGAASAFFSNIYRSNVFSNMVIEDITQVSDTRGGFQYYAMANTITQSTTVLSSSAGPWGQTYANGLMFNGPDNLIRWPQRLSFSGLQIVPNSSGSSTALPIIAGGSNGVAAAPPIINGQDYNSVTVNSSTFTTLIAGDQNQMFFVQDSTGGGGCVGIMTVDSAVITTVANTLTGITFQRAAGVGLQAKCASATHVLRTIAIATGA